MQRNIELAKKLYKEPDKNWLSSIEDLNLHTIFKPVYTLNYNIGVLNKVVSFIILAYDNNSEWINVRQDRYQNRLSILEGINANHNNELFQQILSHDNDLIQGVILKYLIEQTDHRWQEAISLLDYSSKMIYFCNEKTKDKFVTGVKIDKETNQEETQYEYLDPREVSKINQDKGDLLEKAVKTRKTADELLKSIENDFQKLDHVTNSEFGFQYTDVKKFNIMSWEARLKKRKDQQNNLFQQS